jgi:hypothetical protein
VRARHAKVPTPAQIDASRAWRGAALHSCPQDILGGELRRLLAVPRGLECLVVGRQPDRELAWSVSCRGARLAGGAHTARGAIAPEADHRVARAMMARSPMDTGLSLGAARLLGLPREDKGLEVVASPFPPLPTVGAKRRTDHLDLLRGPGRHQEVRSDIPAIAQVDAGEDITVGEVLSDGGTHPPILCGGWRRQHWRHEVGGVGIPGRRAADRIADRMGLALTPVAGLQVVGRGAAHRCGRALVARAPSARFKPRDGAAGRRLPPDRPEDLEGREVIEAYREGVSLQPRAQLIAVRAALPGERLARAGLFRHARLVGAEAVARGPGRRHLLAHPRGRHVAEVIERLGPRFEDACPPVQRPDRRQDLRGIGALGAPRVEPAPGLAGAQDGGQQPLGARRGE